jgi:hypothetical protein
VLLIAAAPPPEALPLHCVAEPAVTAIIMFDVQVEAISMQCRIVVASADVCLQQEGM